MGTVMAPDGSRLYISTGRSRMVLILDTATDQVSGRSMSDRVRGASPCLPDGKTLFTANGPSNDVSVVDIATRQVTKKIPVGEGPWGLAFVERPPL